MATKSSSTERSVRERLLAAADELFYEEGVHTVGIERVLERAGVAKASLYSTFGSKQELVRAYLAGRQEARRERINQRIARLDSPRAKLIAIFELLVERAESSNFRGCAFVNANAASPGSKTPPVCLDARGWLRSLFMELAREAGARAPEQLAQRLALLYDGAMVGAQMEHDGVAANTARDLATALIDAAIAQA
jgi:AcrR family transcriptional regulator